MTTTSRKAVLGSLLALLTIFLAGCPQSTSIAEINRDPGRFAGKDVSIAGQVVDSFGVLGQGAFQIDDGTGRMWVISERFGVPSRGARVRVTGRVASGVTFGGRAFGTVLRETEPRKSLGG